MDQDAANWMIKRMPVRIRKIAVACAARQGETMAQWLSRAVLTQANLEAGERELPPAKPGEPPEFLAARMQAVAVLAQAAAMPLPRDVARHAFAVMRNELRALRGLPPVKPRGKPPPLIGQTSSHDAEVSDALSRCDLRMDSDGA